MNLFLENVPELGLSLCKSAQNNDQTTDSDQRYQNSYTAGCNGGILIFAKYMCWNKYKQRVSAIHDLCAYACISLARCTAFLCMFIFMLRLQQM